MIDAASFADRLRAVMMASGVSVPELCKRAPGLSRQAIYQLLSGVRPKPSFETVCKLADALGMTTDAFRVCSPGRAIR